MEETQSDKELFEFFEKASEMSAGIRLLRIGGPLKFRRLLVGILCSTNFQENKATNAILNKRIPSISVLIADPDEVPFLNRLDCQDAGTWGIWRVRQEVLSFAKSLCALSNLRQNPGDFEIGFHKGDLFCNLGIIGQTTVLTRVYGKRTGHDDSEKSEWLTCENNRLEYYIEHWETIRRRPDTKWINFDFLTTDNSEPKWPSLYKGNAILAKEEDFDEEADKTIDLRHVPKVCRHITNHNAEYAWVSINDELRKSLKHFRPVKKAYIGGIVPPFRKRPPIVMEKLTGFTLFEIAHELRVNKQLTENQEDISRLLGAILFDSIKALRDFRGQADLVIPRYNRTNYQYGNQLKNALNEVKNFIEPVSSSFFDGAIKEVGQLGRGLASKIEFCPFRDAQLKNRIWVTDEPTAEELIKQLLIKPYDYSALQSEMEKNIRDIDFETTGFNVTPWDDIIHILFFENSGILSFEENIGGQIKPSVDPIKSYKDWWGEELDDKTGLWMTVLARSIREFCRRLWYARNMPNTYMRRYGLEKRDYFLDLALYALQKLPKYVNINNLLVSVKKSPQVWLGIGNNKSKPEIIPFHPEPKLGIGNNKSKPEIIPFHPEPKTQIIDELPSQVKEKTNKTSILFLAADPTDGSRLRLGDEYNNIQKILKSSNLRDHFTLEPPQFSVSPLNISRVLLQKQPQIVHFSGHGTSTGALCFENVMGRTHLIMPESLAELFGLLSDQVNCVILNACYSETQAEAISKHIKYVIGVKQEIGDRAAIAFTIGFYQALGEGCSIEDAYEFGRLQIQMQNIPGNLQPILMNNAQCNSPPNKKD